MKRPRRGERAEDDEDRVRRGPSGPSRRTPGTGTKKTIETERNVPAREGFTSQDIPEDLNAFDRAEMMLGMTPNHERVLTDARAATTLWDRVAAAVQSCSSALDEAAAATENDARLDPFVGTPGFGRTSTSLYGAVPSGALGVGKMPAAISDATRKKRATRAALKLRSARSELLDLSKAFAELREFATATQAALFRARMSETGVTRQLQSTAGYAEETTARLKQTSQAHKQAQMTATQLGEALDAANAHIADLSERLRVAESEASEVRRARAVTREAVNALDRAEKSERANTRHKEAVAKLTADNMVFLMRLKESEVELREARDEADSMRLELEERRGKWFDTARKDVERVVQNAMRRAESADAALEAEIIAGERRAEEWGKELARLRAVASQNESLAETTRRAAEALDEAAEAGRRNDLALRESRRREFDALNAQKAASAAMTAAREEMGVLKQRMAATQNALEDQKRVSQSLVEKAQTSVAALATQQKINAGIMKLKNDAEWRMLEMRAGFERAGFDVSGIAVGAREIGDEADASRVSANGVEASRLAGRPGPFEEHGGVNHSALSPLPSADDFGLNTPMPISPGTLAARTREAMRAAGGESPERGRSRPKTVPEASNETATSPATNRGSPQSTRRSPSASPSRSRSPAKQKLGGSGPAWGNSPAKSSKFEDDRVAADAVAEARRVSAEQSRTRARLFSATRKPAEMKKTVAPFFFPNPAATRSSSPGRSELEKSPAAARGSAPEEPFEDDLGTKHEKREVASEETFRNAEVSAAGASVASEPPNEPSRPAPDGWIGGRPVEAGAALPSIGGSPAVSDDDDDDDDDDACIAREKKRSRGGVGRARVETGGFQDLSSSDEDGSLDFDFGVVVEHEAAMTRLLSATTLNGGGYGATSAAHASVKKQKETEKETVPRPTRRALEQEDDSIDPPGATRGTGVSFSNALPRFR
jgi:hypothetical protein